jgi:hypothetical protein
MRKNVFLVPILIVGSLTLRIFILNRKDMLYDLSCSKQIREAFVVFNDSCEILQIKKGICLQLILPECNLPDVLSYCPAAYRVFEGSKSFAA